MYYTKFKQTSWLRSPYMNHIKPARASIWPTRETILVRACTHTDQLHVYDVFMCQDYVRLRNANLKILFCSSFGSNGAFYTIVTFLPQREKAYLLFCASYKVSNQHAHLRSLIRVFISAWRNLASLAIENVPSKAVRAVWSEVFFSLKEILHPWLAKCAKWRFMIRLCECTGWP